jgi:hypothetical protein
MANEVQNTINSSVFSLIDVTNEVTSDCYFEGGSNQIVILNAKKCNDSSADVNLNQSRSINTLCLSSIVTQNDMRNQLAVKAQQQAELVAQQFQFGFWNDISNTIDLFAYLSTVINNTYYNSCVNKFTNNQVAIINCEDSYNLTATVDINSSEDLNARCIYNNESVNDIVNDIKENFDQAGKLKVQNFFAAIIAAIVGVLVVAGIILFIIVIFVYLISRPKPKPAQITIPPGGGPMPIQRPPFPPPPPPVQRPVQYLPPPPPAPVQYLPPPPPAQAPVQYLPPPAPAPAPVQYLPPPQAPASSSMPSSTSFRVPPQSNADKVASQIVSALTSPQNGGPSVAQQISTNLGNAGSQFASKASKQLADQALKILAQKFA